jgi:hypothetical protein
MEAIMAKVDYQPGGLTVGDLPQLKRTVTITGGAYLRGTVLGRITASDKYTLSLSASADGSEDPGPVLAEDVDASGGDVDGPALFSGEFAADRLTFGAGHDADSVEAGWRVAGLPLAVRTRA